MINTKMNLTKLKVAFFVFLGIAMLNSRLTFAGNNKAFEPNVLFISVDDLRPELNCYGFEHIVSPNIDKIASQGVLFEKAYCQQAVCLPSRISLMSGMRPPSTGVMDLKTNFRETIPNIVLLPQHFRNNGYYAIGMGKVLHSEEPSIWDEWIDIKDENKLKNYNNPETLKKIKELEIKARKKGLKGKAFRVATKGPAYEGYDASDEKYHDGKMTDFAIQKLNELKDETFFMALGYKKPHLPFVAPKKYFDLYDINKIKLADNPDAPKGAPTYAGSSWGELRAYDGIPKKGPVKDEEALKLIQAYYACVSFVDAQIGRVIDELERLGLKNNTIIILWGDHGWKLGEHGMWAKHTNYENDAWSPLIISYPGYHMHGISTKALVEYVDIYPTLCELTNTSIPDYCEGLSFAPLLKNPELEWKKAAFSYYPKAGNIGYSIKTERYRYTEWVNKKTGEIDAQELYDHKTDSKENTNLANKKKYKSIVEEHSKIIAEGWESALPEK